MNSYPSTCSFSSPHQNFSSSDSSSLLYDTSGGQLSSSASANTSAHTPATTTSQTKPRILPPSIGTKSLPSPLLPQPHPLSAGPPISGHDYRSVIMELDRERNTSARLAAALENEREKCSQFRNALRRHQTESAHMNDAYASYQQVTDILRRRCVTLESELIAARDAVNMASREAIREQDLRVRVENELDHCRRAVRDAAQRAIEVLVFSAEGDTETQQVARDVALWRSQARDTRNSGLASTLVPVTHIKTVLGKLEEYAKQWRSDRALYLRAKLHQQQQQQEAVIAAAITATNIHNSLHNSYNSENSLHNANSGSHNNRSYSTHTSATSSNSSNISITSSSSNSTSILRSTSAFSNMTEDGHSSYGDGRSTTKDIIPFSQEGTYDGGVAESHLNENAANSRSSQVPKYSSGENNYGITHTSNMTSRSDMGVIGNNKIHEEDARGASGGELNKDRHERVDSSAADNSELERLGMVEKESLKFFLPSNTIDEPSSCIVDSLRSSTSSISVSKPRGDSAGSTITLASFWPATWPNDSQSRVDPPPGLGIKETSAVSKWSEVVKLGDISSNKKK